MSGNWGAEAEQEARSWIGEYGLPDFVYKPRRSGGREISDGIVAVADRGLILETKAREPQRVDSPEVARRWLDNRISKAIQQIQISRELLSQENDIVFRSYRSDPESSHSQGSYYKRQFPSHMHWQGVVLIEHDNLPDGYTPALQEYIAIMTVSDWQALCYRLRSAFHVIEYVRRVIESSLSCALGDEHSRYGNFVLADSDSAEQLGGSPMLPNANVGRDDIAYLEMVLEWVHEDFTHREENAPLSWQSSDEYRLLAEQVDKLPVHTKVKFGKGMCRIIEKASEQGHTAVTKLIPSGDQARFIFFADSMFNWPDADSLTAHLFALTAVRHEELKQAIPDNPQPTLLLARLAGGHEGEVRRTYCFIDGRDDLGVPEEVRDAITRRYGELNLPMQPG
ncbi:hypothetical protein [Candidatus Poriferisocius sp.]|uniref:hypothetical protein n=1 Tax=Candidatus Poriferisocius sp. TaxID=3101276 RepID=UPI003B01518F